MSDNGKGDPLDGLTLKQFAQRKNKEREQEVQDLVHSVRTEPFHYATAIKWLEAVQDVSIDYKYEPIRLLFENYIERLIQTGQVEPVTTYEEVFKIMQRKNFLQEGDRNKKIVGRHLSQESVGLVDHSSPSEKEMKRQMEDIRNFDPHRTSLGGVDDRKEDKERASSFLQEGGDGIAPKVPGDAPGAEENKKGREEKGE